MAQGPDLVVPQAAQVKIFYGYASNTILGQNVLGAIKLGATVINQTLANTLATAVRSAWTTNLGPLMSGGSTCHTIGIRDISAANQTEYIGTGAIVTGTGSGDQLPGANATCVSLKTALSGPRHRGRVYVSGWDETQNTTTGAIVSAANTAAVAFVTAVQTAFAANGLTLAVISRPSYPKQTVVTVILPGGASDVQTRSEPARPGEVNAVTSIAARNAVWDSQRRRNGAGGGSTILVQPTVMSYLDDASGEWVTSESGEAAQASRRR